MTDWSIADAEKLYRVKRWGGGYFEIGENGNLQITPDPTNPNVRIDFKAILEEIKEEGIQMPIVVRFHDILRSQVVSLNKTFRRKMDEAGYKASYMGVYPIKVNQMREVVEEVVDAGEPFNFGLEAGSKAELLTVLAYNTNAESLTILNGYKDEEFMRLALMGRKMGRKIIVVIEKFSELLTLTKLSKQIGVEPLIGIRAKMFVKGKGRWEGSGGDKAKFGLSTSEIISAVNFLNENNMGHCLKLLHFHIGSQLTDIRAVKDAVTEGARIYSELHHLGAKLEYVDVGGGLGIDYDGSHSTSESSRNYTMEEYVGDIVYGMMELCDMEDVPHPILVSESGRALTAHHSCVVTEVVSEIKPNYQSFDTSPGEDDHLIVNNIRDLAQNLDRYPNSQEVYNDASDWKEQAINAFKLNVLSLGELAKVETLYWQILKQLDKRQLNVDVNADLMWELEEQLASQYLGNFSVFQSAADTWAIDQILPVVPLTRLNEKPTINCSLVDITCDSDGKIDNFIGDGEISKTIPMHPLKEDEQYYIGLFLTGAYQDVMGDMHNLFGRLNEVHIYSYDDDPEDFYIEEVVAGSSVSNVLSIMQYNPNAMAQDVKRMIDKCIANGQIKPREGVKWIDFYEDCLKGYTYLKTNSKGSLSVE
ncbi:biosynthetic arginine decarboxylase [Paraneptunicella aestuarii]|uniref:biosynthetic arginine decarboxylase n=1 Tax=Paraneptunicella aestuarii TaxID=2831148 RepID=UPI001E62D637|nr:biosynthetic arginine decarboxylase [Paraneptunicella aestuarii]UAA38941.1 biosynthetic arginine decarboxylase [Paraneptunicella aestuarii]